MSLQSPAGCDKAKLKSPDGVGAAPPRRPLPKWLLLLIVFVGMQVGQVLIWLAGRLSYPQTLRLSQWITLRFEPLTRRRRQNNLRRFYQHDPCSAEKLQQVDAAHLGYLARMRAEVTRGIYGTPAELAAQVDFEGEEHLRAVLARKRGVLLVSGHTATWWVLPAYLAFRGYPVTGIFMPIKFPRVERMLLRLTKRYNVGVVFVGRDAYPAVQQAMERNEIICLTFDITVRARRGRTYPFGAAGLQVDPGPAILAVRNSMPSLQATCVHQPGQRHRLSILNPVEAELTPHESSADDLCRLWTGRLEQEVRQNPEQWWPWGYVDFAGEQTAEK